MRASALWLRRVTDTFWFVPAVCTMLAVTAALLLVRLDRALTAASLPVLFGGGPDGARAVLGSITSSMISFTALVFSITMVVLQLTSGQFSPRILRTFLRDRVSQTALGTFAATFVYAMTVLRTVEGETTGEIFVPRIATTVSFLLVVGSVAVFIWYLQHIANAIRAANVLEAVARETRGLIERRYPLEPDYPPPPEVTDLLGTVVAERPGVVTAVDAGRLVTIAARRDSFLELVPRIGDFVPEGATVFLVWRSGDRPGDRDSSTNRELTAAVRVAVERTMEQDVGYGFRQLTDVAERVLAPSTNDHTTAVQAIDHVHDLLRRLVVRPMPQRVSCDGSGTPRLWVHEEGIKPFLEVGIQQVARWASESPRVMTRLRAAVDDVLAVARPEHLDALVAQRERLVAARDVSVS